ncbi:MAG: TIGR03564 family F420-dependent LLM class oxidoreductase [Acidimicrobiia bacterium]|nr:TIGR03564 family F420-dependent LLM class oxidoreductase [Acidimicrobiia bacterium]
MDIGFFGGSLGRGGYDAMVSAATEAADAGLHTFWLSQIVGEADAMTLLGALGRDVPGIRLGTSVVPTYPRHPFVMAEQARTVNLLCGGRFSLGIGLSHQPVVEGMWGMSFDKPLRHAREYLDALLPLIQGDDTRAKGETIIARGRVTVGDPDDARPPVYLAALGPQMLKLAGRTCQGTITWMTGARTLASHTVPTITEAAAEANRPTPEIVAGFPMWVTDDVDHARERAATVFEIYGQLPSYRAMLDREGLDGPADLTIVGDEDTCAGRVEELRAAGVTQLSAAMFADNAEDTARTKAFLATLI